MMKTLCVAAVVLSLTSVCQPASLACEKLLKPVDKGPGDLSGRWYVIAMSTESCMFTTLLKAFLWPSVEVDITSTSTPNVYQFEYKFKVYGHCLNDSEEILYEDNTIFEVDSEIPTKHKVQSKLLQTGCPDCMVLKLEDQGFIDTLWLFSRRVKLTAPELKEFESQAECLGWSKPQLFDTDHEFKNCPSIDDVDDTETASIMLQGLKNMYTVPFSCFSEIYRYYSMSSDWVQQMWSSLW